MALGNLKVTLDLIADKYLSGMRSAQRELRDFEKSVAPTTTMLTKFGQAATSLGLRLSVAVSAPLAAIAGVGVAFNAMQEQAQISFTTLLGSGHKAQTFLEGLKDFAAKTPFEFEGLVKASQRMLAMGFDAEALIPTLTAVGDAAAAMGGSQETIDRIILALGQMQARGKVATQEMNQLTEAGINGWKILAESIGVSEMKLRDMVEKGAVPSGKAVQVLVEGMNKQFGGMMSQQSTTFQGLMSTLKDESRFLAGEMTKSLFDFVKPKMAALVDQVHLLRVGFEELPDSIKATAGAFLVLGSAAGPALVGVGQVAFGIKGIIDLLGVLKLTSLGAFAALGTAATIAAGAAAVAWGQISKIAALRESPEQLGQSLAAIPQGTGTAGNLVALGSIYSAYRGFMDVPTPQLPAKLLPGGLPPEAQAAFAQGDPALRKVSEQWDLLGGKTAKAKTAVEQMMDSFKKEGNEAADLETVLATLYNRHEPLANIQDVLGSKIADVTGDYVAANQPLPEYIAYYNAMIKNSKELAAKKEEEDAFWEGYNKRLLESQQRWKDYNEELQNGLKVTEEVTIVRDADTQRLLDNAAAIGQHKLEVDRSNESLLMQQTMANDTALRMIELANAGASAEQIEAQLGTTAEQLAEQMRNLGGPIDEVTLKSLDQLAAATKLQDSWGQAFGAISDKLVDMIVDFDFSFKRLGDIAKDTAKSLLGSFLDGFLKPFKDGLTDLGEGLARTIGGALFGTGGGNPQDATGGLFGGLLGSGSGILGGLFGKGGGTAAVGGAAGAAAGTGLSAALGFASLGASLIGPIAGIIGGIGSGKRAQDVASNLENSVFNALTSILNDPNLTGTMKSQMVEGLWQGAQDQLAQLSTTDPDFAKAAAGATASLTPVFTNTLKDLAPWVEKEAQDKQAAEKPTSGGGNTYQFGDININLRVPDGDPETILDYITRNVAGITEEIRRQMDLKDGAVVYR